VVQSALLLIDKPAGFTSHDVVAKCRKILGTRKIGHAGTLDPMATGLLVLGVEAGTKLLTFIVGNDKTYKATIRLGQSTVTDDAEGEVIGRANEKDLAEISEAQIIETLKNFLGKIQQVPSSVSAIKVSGERAYDLVRAGAEVSLKSREVEISEFSLIAPIRKTMDHIDFDVTVDCSSGTYIRALARDIGKQLGVGGHLTALRRTRIGKFDVSDSQNFEEISVAPKFLSMLTAISSLMPVVEISNEQETWLRQGKRFDIQIGQVSAAARDSRIVAIVEPYQNSKVKSLVVFQEDNNGSN